MDSRRNFFHLEEPTLKKGIVMPLPVSGDPCIFFCEDELQEQQIKPTRESLYTKRIESITMNEEGKSNKLQLLKQELQSYFQFLRKY